MWAKPCLFLNRRGLAPCLSDAFVGTAKPDAKTIERAPKDIETAAGIRGGRFPADPAYQACLYCPYRSICPRGEGE